MPLVDPVYQIKVNPLDGFRRSWDPQGVFSSLILEKAYLDLISKQIQLDKALLLTKPTLSINSKTIFLENDVQITLPVIASVNSNQDVPVAAQNIVIAGSDFGPTAGTVTLNGHSINVVSWSPSGDQIIVNWPDTPFDPVFADTPINTQQLIAIIRNDAETDSRNVLTIGGIGDYTNTISSIPGNSIYTNDTNIIVGDIGYIRITSGSADTVNASTGVIDGISTGTTITYVVYDVSLQSWSTPATENWTPDV